MSETDILRNRKRLGYANAPSTRIHYTSGEETLCAHAIGIVYSAYDHREDVNKRQLKAAQELVVIIFLLVVFVPVVPIQQNCLPVSSCPAYGSVSYWAIGVGGALTHDGHFVIIG